MSITQAVRWITGDEYAAEWSRLRKAGFQSHSPEFEDLLRRVDERDEYLWQTYGLPLKEQHPGKWVAISAGGEVILGNSDLEVCDEGDRRFGTYNYYAAQLDEHRGAPRTGPRAG